MHRGLRVLDTLGVRYCLSRGLILGFHRDRAFLPNDTDIDIDMFDDRSVYAIIKHMPLDLILVTSSAGRYMQLAFIDNDTQVVFDIFVYHLSGTRYLNRNFYGYFWLPEATPTNLATIKFKENQYPSHNPAWFCPFWYGKHWRTPEPQALDWSINYRNNCEGFIYTGERNVLYL